MKKLLLILALGLATIAYAFTPVANPTNAFKASKRFAFDATQLSVPEVAEAPEADQTLTFSGIEFDYQGIYSSKYLYLVFLYGPKSAGYLPQAYFWITKDTDEKNFVGDFTPLQTLYAWGAGASDYGQASNGKLNITKGEKYNYTISGSFTYDSKLYSFSTTANAEYNDESYPYEPEEATTLNLTTTGEFNLKYLDYGYVFVESEDTDGNVLILSFYTTDQSFTTFADGTYNIKSAANSFLPGYWYAGWETTPEEEGPDDSYVQTASNDIFYLTSGTVVAKTDEKGLHLTISAGTINKSTVNAECLIPATGNDQTDKRAIYLNTGGNWWGNSNDYYIHAWKDKNNPTTVKFEYVADYLYRAYINKDYTGAFIFYLYPNETLTSIDEIWDNYMWDNRETTIPSDKDMYVITSSYMGVWSAVEYGEWAVYDPTKSEESYAYGSCGAKVEYAVKRNTNTLVISGTGDMDHYSTSYNNENPKWYWAPWEGWKNIISALSLSEGLTTIGAYAFELCPNITKVTIPSTVTAIGTGAFNAKNFTAITCQATMPPKMVESPKTSTTKHIFQNADFSIPLYVPSGSVAAYKKADYWKDFTNIQAIDGSEGEGGSGKTVLSVAEAIALVNQMEENTTSEEEVTVEGYVVDAQAFNWAYKDQKFFLSDTWNNSGKQVFLAYYCVAKEGEKVVPVFNGDKVRLTGKLTNYANNGEVIPEIKNGIATFVSKVDGDRSEPVIETITVAKALKLAASLAQDEVSKEYYYIIGYVTNITQNNFNTDYNNMTFWIADSKGTASSNAEGAFYVYRGKPDVELAVGDKVQVATALYNYKGLIESETAALVRLLDSQDTQKYTLVVAVNDERLGTVKGGGVYNRGTSVTLTATAAKGAQFMKWSDGVTSATRTVTVSADATYTALFKAVASSNVDKVDRGNNQYDEKSGVVEPSKGKGLAPKNTEQPETEEETTTLEPARKIFQDGHIYILRDGKVYSLTGMPL